LYSICFNILTGLLLWRVWYADVSPAVISGLYFILTGAFRFIEEAYRGEIQTILFKKLTIYQWLSVLFVFAGIFLTTVRTTAILSFHGSIDAGVIWLSIGAGSIWAFGMGIDFPKSNMRFSRLTG
jgi:hypothetical protein